MTAQRVDQHRSLGALKGPRTLCSIQHGIVVDGLDGDKAHRGRVTASAIAAAEGNLRFALAPSIYRRLHSRKVLKEATAGGRRFDTQPTWQSPLDLCGRNQAANRDNFLGR